MPSVEILPQSAEFELLQVTLQVGLMLLCNTVAVNPCCAPAASVTPVGAITICATVMSRLAVAVLVVSACETAVIVTLGDEGTVLGAVYVPVLLMVP